jgi:hypothetical protein
MKRFVESLHSTTTALGSSPAPSQPDYTGACADLCGFVANDTTASITTASSHEMVEAITDAAIGLATAFGPPLGWYDKTHGEIGDICEVQSQGQKVAGFYVQTGWSNAQGKCVISGTSACVERASRPPAIRA